MSSLYGTQLVHYAISTWLIVAWALASLNVQGEIILTNDTFKIYIPTLDAAGWAGGGVGVEVGAL